MATRLDACVKFPLSALLFQPPTVTQPDPGKSQEGPKVAVLRRWPCKKQLHSGYGFPRSGCARAMASNVVFDSAGLCLCCLSTLLLSWLCPRVGLFQHRTMSQSGAYALPLPLLLSPRYFCHQLSFLVPFVVQLVPWHGWGLLGWGRDSPKGTEDFLCQWLDV